jgi:solute carrier family 25 protein 39/40
MSRQWDRVSQSSEEFTTSFESDDRFDGHDRIHGDNPIPGVTSTIAMTRDNDDVEIAITAGQKMMSAMSGSLLTSVLGTRFCCVPKYFRTC